MLPAPPPDAPRSVPIVPLLLGAAGLIPFLGLAVLCVTGSGLFGWSAEAIRTALATHGAVIASFLGGIRWGVALRNPDQVAAARDYVLAIVPSLLAWFALALPPDGRLAALGALILALGVIDQDLVRRGEAPPWFGRLRLGLSTGAGLALLAAALG